MSFCGFPHRRSVGPRDNLPRLSPGQRPGLHTAGPSDRRQNINTNRKKYTSIGQETQMPAAGVEPAPYGLKVPSPLGLSDC